MGNGIPDSWKKSKLILLFKNKGDILECNNYRGNMLGIYEKDNSDFKPEMVSHKKH